MIKVENSKAVRNLANKSFRANKTRNLIAIIAISLTALLFTTLFTMGIGTVESLQNATMRQAGGDGHAVLKYINDQQFQNVKDHPLIKEIAYARILCDDVTNPEFLKRRAEFCYYDDIALKLGFCEPTHGHKPLAENEVIADTKTLQLMDVPLEVGAPLSLTLDIRGQEVKRDFVLAGWWESDPVFNIGQIITSGAYVDAHLKELVSTFDQDMSYTGVIKSYIMFRNSFDLEGKLEKVITESGYSLDENAPNYIANNVNWSYLSTNFGMDAGTMVALFSGLLLIIFTGYLIIYNVFQISVMRDIRFYGLLKTIGTTGKQIRRIISRQAFILSVIGIPLGLVAGFFLGKSMVPLLMSNSSYAGSAVTVSPNPFIFIASALFAYITVIISTFKPGRMAAAVSPVEAVRYTDNSLHHYNKAKKSYRGSKLPKMALSNLGRNKRRTILTIISLSLSLVLLNTVFTLSQSIDMNKFLGMFNDTDFLIAHADYFNNDFYGPENQTTESIIQAVQARPGFQEGGRLYGGRAELFTVEDDKNTAQNYNFDCYGNFFSAVYGLENLPLERLELIDGEMDYDKLASGKYILEGIKLDDYSKPIMDSKHFEIGDTVTLHNYKGTEEAFDDREYTTQEFTVLGHVAIKNYTASDRTGWDYNFYLPAEIYKTLVEKAAVMSYAFNVEDDKEVEMENFLKAYTDTDEPLMNYSSKLTSQNEFSGMRNTVIMIGGALSFIIGLIGILNFINAILTGIITRKKEFAILQSIGMTRSQLSGMLIFEGLYYTIFTAILSVILGVGFSFLIIKPLSGLIWFLSYHFILWPILLILPFLLILGIIIPYLLYISTNKQSIVERLREAE